MSNKKSNAAAPKAHKKAPIEPQTPAQTVALIGAKIRETRSARGMTLQSLADLTKLTPSMLSLVERGRASPSIGSLILIANALSVAMSDLIPSSTLEDSELVVRAGSRPVVESSERLRRAILRNDRNNGVVISVTLYRPNTGSSLVSRGHAGLEHGFVLEGELTVELEGALHRLRPGDLISYHSTRPHRIWNYSKRNAKALWINLHKGESIDNIFR